MTFAAVATIASRAPQADDHPLLIETHRAAGLKCAQCHQQQPPRLAPSVSTCLACHGDQAALANRTSGASPNPHAPPHLPSGEIQICGECHHVHRKSEVSCNTCHREFHFDVK
ncbi:MAG: cytochrome c3 family protein [Bradyrhizobium sp.]